MHMTSEILYLIQNKAKAMAREMKRTTSREYVGGREIETITIENNEIILQVDAFWESGDWLEFHATGSIDLHGSLYEF